MGMPLDKLIEKIEAGQFAEIPALVQTH